MRALLLIVTFFFNITLHSNELYDSLFKEVTNNPNVGRVALIEYQSQNKLSKKEQGIFSNLMGLSYALNQNWDSSLYYFYESLSLLDSSDAMYPKVLANIAIVYRSSNQLLKSSNILLDAKIIASNYEHEEALALVYGELSSVMRLLGISQNALDYLLKSIEILNRLEIKSNKIFVEKQKLANLYLENKDYVFAKSIYDKILPELERSVDRNSFLFSVINFAEILSHIKDSQAAIKYLVKYEHLVGDDQTSLNYLLYNSKKALLLEKTKAPEAEEVYQNVLNNVFTAPNTYTLPIVNQLLSFYNKQEDTEILQYIIYKTNTLLSKTQFPIQSLIEYYGELTKVSSKSSDYQKAFNYLSSKNMYVDSLQNIRNEVIEKGVMANYKNQLLQIENERLLQNAKSNQTILAILILLSLFLLISILLATYIFYSKRKYLNIQKQIVEDKLDLELELKKTNEQLIQIQKEEILRSAQQNQYLKEQIGFIEKSLVHEKNQNETLKQLKDLDIYNPSYDDLIKKLRVLDRLFFDTLVQICPKITKSELDFCAFIRMGLDYKKIAHILGISHESVHTKKYRLMKKLKLNKEIDFYIWISQI
jgi:DNA-binding CsgD family transcriptional regulator